MQCRQCGSESVENAKFCASCGASLSDGNEKPEETAADKPAQEVNNHTSSLYQGTIRSNPFSEFYAPQSEHSHWRRRLLIASLLTLVVAIVAGGAHYYSHRKYEIAELAKLPAPTAAATTAQPAPPKQDSIFPCPSEAPFCIGSTASKIKDPSCAADKPIWAHYSEDGGTTWKRAGCYATEAQAKQGLNDTLGIISPKTHSLAQQAKKTPEAKSEKPAQPSAKHMVSGKENESLPKNHEVTFKGPFGITVEKRAYPSEQMKEKALDLWERERKILEPDGSINDKYMVKPKTGASVIPGH